jgi:DNA-binding beta-propeller fold protein YncE
MVSNKNNLKIGLILILIPLVACSLFKSVESIDPETKPNPTNTEVIIPILTSTRKSKSTPTPTPTPAFYQEPLFSNGQKIVSSESRRLWASEASSDLEGINVEAVLGPPEAFECNQTYSSWYNNEPLNSPNENFLNLKYSYALIPNEINIVINGNPGGNLRVELLDSSSGLGVEIFTGIADTKGNCPGTISIPVETDLSINTVILSFKNSDQPMYIDAVAIVGKVPGLIDIPVFWRIPIPADSLAEPDSDFPGGLATDQFGNIYVANGNNGIHRYDVEGNLLKNYSVPNESNIRDVAIDNQGQIVLTDLVYKWYVTLDRDGVQVDAGGEDFGWNGPREIAVHPITGNIYLMDETDEFSRIRVYSPKTNQLIQDIYLESIGLQMHKGLAFDQEGYLYTIDQLQAVILKMNAETGEVVNSLGYSVLGQVSPSDLALDEAGKIYVLLNASPEDIAVYVLDKYGFLENRFGFLTYDGSNWGEGVFFFPVSISVSPDGRFLTICENGFLTTYLINLDL